MQPISPARTHRALALLLLAPVCALFTSSCVAADSSLPEIVVTADFRNAGELSLPTSVTVINEEVIAARSAQHIEELLNLIPNMNFAMGTNRARFLQIRGIGERSQFAAPLNPSVGLLVDNVDYSGVGTVATLLDVAQVEVLRGPQGTRYGANALAGLVNIRTNDPTPDFHASARLGVAQYNTNTVSGIVNGALTDGVNARLAIEQHQSDGYYTNRFLGTDDNNQRDELSIRGKLLTNPGAAWTLLTTVAHTDVDNGYDAFTLDNTRQTLSDEPGFDRQQSTAISLDNHFELANTSVDLILAASDSDMDYGYDEDWAFTGIHPFGYTSTDHYFRDRRTVSAEVRWLSNEAARIFDGTTDWIVGAYYLTNDETLQRDYTFAAPFASAYDFTTLAVFTEISVSLSLNTGVSLGIRAEDRDTTYRDSDGVAFSPTDTLWGGRLALTHNLDSGTLLYASVSRGYKAGGFNTDGSLDADLREFGEEYLIEYEAGVKTTLANGRMQVRAAVFLDDRHDQQVKSSVVRTRSNGSTEFIDFLGNAATGTNQGLELEAQWQATASLHLHATAGLLDATFDEFINEFGEDLSGRDQAQAPAYMFTLGATFEQGPWFAGLSVDAKDEYFFSDRHAVRSTSVALVNAHAGYRSERWQVRLWSRNLTDEDVLTRGFGSFGNDPRKGYVTEPYFQFGEPRIVGVSVETSI